jgi:hypothetical protein
VFDSSGDGMCAAFSTPADAAVAAIESQEDLQGDDAMDAAAGMAMTTTPEAGHNPSFGVVARRRIRGPMASTQGPGRCQTYAWITAR